jgi:RNA polymerase sigma-70 factor, ECF subfamily
MTPPDERDDHPVSAEQEPTIEATDADHRHHLALLEAAIDDPRAFEPLYGRYAEDVYYFCYRRLGHPEEAADATSQVFVKVLRALPGYIPDPTSAGASFRAWLFRIAQRTVIDLQRRHRPTDTIDTVPEDEPVQIVDPERSPDDHLIGNENARRVRAMLSKLPDRQRRIVELRLADLSGQEIAHAMNISLSAVKSAQFRAFRTLRRLLNDPATTDTRSQP